MPNWIYQLRLILVFPIACAILSMVDEVIVLPIQLHPIIQLLLCLMLNFDIVMLDEMFAQYLVNWIMENIDRRIPLRLGNSGRTWMMMFVHSNLFQSIQ